MNSENKANQKIRDAMRKAALSQWMLAAALGISENTLNRWLRKELPSDVQRKMLQIIKQEANNAR